MFTIAGGRIDDISLNPTAPLLQNMRSIRPRAPRQPLNDLSHELIKRPAAALLEQLLRGHAYNVFRMVDVGVMGW